MCTLLTYIWTVTVNIDALKKPLYVYAMSGFNAKRGFILFIHVTEKVWEIKRHEFISLLFNLSCLFLNFLEYNFYAMNLVSKPLQYIK